jgi:hypothetical protein
MLPGRRQSWLKIKRVHLLDLVILAAEWAADGAERDAAECSCRIGIRTLFCFRPSNSSMYQSANGIALAWAANGVFAASQLRSRFGALGTLVHRFVSTKMQSSAPQLILTN